jgi:uncharacterized protein DUF4292
VKIYPGFIGILISTLLIAACSSTAVITPTDSPGVVMEKVRARNQTIRSYSGRGKMSIDSQEISGAGNIELRVSKPDSALIKLTGPFGISIGSGLITSDDFTFYDGTKNSAIHGKTNSINLRRAFRMSIEFSEFLGILSGSFGFDRAPSGAIPQGKFENGNYTLLFNTVNGTEEYRVNTDYAAVSRFTQRDKEGEIVQDINFRDFRKVSGIYLPHIIKISKPMDDQSLSIVYERQKLNEMPMDLVFSVPAGVKVTEI